MVLDEELHDKGVALVSAGQIKKRVLIKGTVDRGKHGIGLTIVEQLGITDTRTFVMAENLCSLHYLAEVGELWISLHHLP